MSRGKAAIKRITSPDPVFNSELVGRFINFLMERGKKSVAQAIVYEALEIVKTKRKEDPIKIFEQVISTARPQVEVRSKRVGGANYQVPMPVVGKRQDALAFRWIITSAKARKGSMAKKLAQEFLDILDGTGGTIKKKEDIHRMAEANKAFAHFARRG